MDNKATCDETAQRRKDEEEAMDKKMDEKEDSEEKAQEQPQQKRISQEKEDQTMVTHLFPLLIPLTTLSTTYRPST